MTLKLLTWNTLFAGKDESSTHRHDAQVAAIREVKPDVFLMQEAREYDAAGSARLYDMEQKLGMRGFLAVAPRTGQNIAIFVAGGLNPLAFTQDSINFHHVFASLRVRLSDSDKEVTFHSVHLSPNSVDVRRREAAFVSLHADPAHFSLVAGDFNSMSPHDPQPSDWAGLPPHHRARYLADDLQDTDRSVIARLEKAGWNDLGLRLGFASEPTVPTNAYRDAEFPTMRCDFVFASDTLASLAREYQVIRNAATDFASDHYPVLVTFEV